VADSPQLRRGSGAPAISGKKTRDAGNGVAQIVLVGQEDEAEMIRCRPVEAAALDEQYALFLQQFGNEVLVIVDRIDLRDPDAETCKAPPSASRN
jgi:hypothetical protein